MCVCVCVTVCVCATLYLLVSLSVVCLFVCLSTSAVTSMCGFSLSDVIIIRLVAQFTRVIAGPVCVLLYFRCFALRWACYKWTEMCKSVSRWSRT